MDVCSSIQEESLQYLNFAHLPRDSLLYQVVWRQRQLTHITLLSGVCFTSAAKIMVI